VRLLLPVVVLGLVQRAASMRRPKSPFGCEARRRRRLDRDREITASKIIERFGYRGAIVVC